MSNPRFDDFVEVRCNFCGHLYRVEGKFLVDNECALGIGEPCYCGEPLSWYGLTEAVEWDNTERGPAMPTGTIGYPGAI